MQKFWFCANSEKWTVIIRVTFGLVMFLHGAQKALGIFGGRGWSATAAGFSSMGIPGIIAHLVIIGEFFGGLALLAGFLTRISAAGNGIIMAGAVCLHFKGGFFARGGGFEYPFVLLMMAVFLIVKGPGRWSVDALLFGQSE